MADGPIDLTIVTPERAVVHENVDELQIPGREGYFGVLPGHAPLFSELKIGVVGYRKGTSWTQLAVSWGFVEVLPNQVRILAETAERSNEIDVERAQRAKERAEQRLTRTAEDTDYDRARVALERALVRLQVSGKSHSSTQSH
jgi:F-type H+-transporting ATPase subunit epsilon